MVTMHSSLFIILAVVYAIGAEYAPVHNLDLPMYMGRWYQVYKNRFDMTFQGDGTCAVADYGLLTSNVTVLNSQIDKDGSIDQIEGYAFYKPGNSGGDLTVTLDGVSRAAPYWVLELGPMVNDQYDYSIVSDDNRISLFVLARNVSNFYKMYDDTVQNSLMKYGFTGELNKPLVMSQDKCDYSKYDM